MTATELDTLTKFLIYGVTARAAYSLRVPMTPKKDGEVITLMWIAVTSLVLSYTFSQLPWRAESMGHLYVTNTIASFVIGYVLGALKASVHDVQFHRRKFLAALQKNIKGPPPTQIASDEFFRELGKEKVTVEMQNGSLVHGGVQYWDRNPDQPDAYTVVLLLPQFINQNTWKTEDAFAAQILISSDQIASIRRSTETSAALPSS